MQPLTRRSRIWGKTRVRGGEVLKKRIVRSKALGLAFLAMVLPVGSVADESGPPVSNERQVESDAAELRDTGPKTANWDEAITHGRQAMEEMIAEDQTPGVAVAVAVGGEVVWSEGFGFADVERGIEAVSKTRFGIGSISKTLTMAAVMSLVDDGLLDLDAPIEKYLADWPHAGKSITVRRIAVHQSGLSDTFAIDHYQTTDHFPTIDSAYQEIKNETLTAEPGSQTVYATGLYTIIGRVMESVTGQPYLEVMEQRVFEPAGLSGVAPNDPTRDDLERTQFYVEAEKRGMFELGPPYDPSHKLPGAGFLATAEDLAKFGAALLNATIISEQAREEMFRPVPLASGKPAEFALGLRSGEFKGTPLIHLPGGGIGISSWLLILPERDFVLAAVGNVSTAPVGGDAADEIIEAFSQQP
jgi:CubicO group peptidase (beta-lactamase class C family)